MKIGIFGDSYADHHHIGTGTPWHRILRNQFNLDATSHGVNGSSLHYSYSRFKEIQESYDKIVFLLTGPGRLTLPLPNEYLDLLQAWEHVTSAEAFNSKIEQHNIKPPYLRNTGKALDGYYKYIMDVDKDALFHQLLVKEIKHIRPDALLIPCFYLTGEENWHHSSMMSTISDLDLTHYNLDHERAMWADIRHCHMSQENNYVFASMIAEWAKTGSFNFKIDKFVKSYKPVETYFRMDVYNLK